MHPEYWNGMVVVSRGANRVCVRDPDSPAHCLKYMLAPGRTQRPPRAWQFRKRRAGDPNLAELLAWRRIAPRLGTDQPWRVAACEGLVDTPAGRALRCRLVRDAGGHPAPSLRQLLARDLSPADTGALAAAVSRFEQWAHRQAIPLFDLNSGNLACIRRDGRPELVCVDLKAILVSKELVPVSRWSRRLMHAKITRRAARLRERITSAPR